MKRSAFWARLLALVLVLGLVIGCFAGCSSKVTDNDDDDDDKSSVSETKEETPSSETEKTAPTASTSVERPLPTDPSDEVTEPSTEATESTSSGLGPVPTLPPEESTEPSSEATEATEPSTEVTEPTAGLDLTMVGTYWLYNLIEYDVFYDYQDIIDYGLTDSYMELFADGTIKACSVGEMFDMTWDSNTMTITDSDGTYDFTLEDGVLTILGPDSTLIYVIEGSPLLELPEDPTDPIAPTDPITEPSTKATEPPTTEPPVEYVTLTVHAVDPDWSYLYFWGWNSITEENLSAEWPGEVMGRIGSSNVYTLYIPTWIDSGVLYANSCNTKTEDFPLDTSGDIWIVVNVETITILDREPTAEELKPETTEPVPPEPETFTVHAYVDNSVCIWGVPNFWAWNQETLESLYEEWPGEAMTSEGSGWYAIEVPTTMDALVISGVDVQTMDILLDGEPEVWVVCNSGDDAVAYAYEPSGSELLPPSAPTTFTLRAKVPANWENPSCWAWEYGGEDVFEAWPGEAMTLSDGWYTIELPTWADCFIVNANEGADQIDDVMLYEISDIWILISDDKITYYNYEPTAADLADHGF